MESVAVSPDGGLLAIDFGDDSTSFIYKIDVQSGNATRLTDAKVGRESSPAFFRMGSESHTPIRLAKGSRPASSSRTLMVPICTHGRLREGTITGLCSRLTVKQPFLPGLRTIGNYSPIAQPHPHGWDLYAADSDGASVRQQDRRLGWSSGSSAAGLELVPTGVS
jgi:hypothetical protein